MHEEKTETIDQNNKFSMDNQPVVTPSEPSQAPSNAEQTPITVPGNKGSINNDKGFYLIVAFIALVLVALGGAYIYFSNQSSKSQDKATTNSTAQSEASQSAVTQSSLTDQLNSLDLGNLDSEFTSVDQNIKSL